MTNYYEQNRFTEQMRKVAFVARCIRERRELEKSAGAEKLIPAVWNGVKTLAGGTARGARALADGTTRLANGVSIVGAHAAHTHPIAMTVAGLGTTGAGMYYGGRMIGDMSAGGGAARSQSDHLDTQLREQQERLARQSQLREDLQHVNNTHSSSSQVVSQPYEVAQSNYAAATTPSAPKSNTLWSILGNIGTWGKDKFMSFINFLKSLFSGAPAAGGAPAVATA